MRADDRHLLERIQSLGGAFVAVERDFVLHHGDVKLHASEIHLMKAVAFDPGGNATGLAQRLGITKGAVSQTMTRLVKKGVIRKEGGSANNELRVVLTHSGYQALKTFHRQTATQWKDIADYVEALSPEEYQAVTGFLTRLRTFLECLSGKL